MHIELARRRRAVTVRVAAVALAVALAVVLAPLLGAVVAQPAAAHDRLVSSDPEDGARLTSVPTEVTLTFSGEVLGTGAQVAVTADGEPVDDVVVAVDGETLTATLPTGLPPAKLDVRWRVVSADGHPIEGELGYWVDAGESPVASPSGSSRAPRASTPAQTQTQTPTRAPTSSAPSSEHQHGGGAPGVALDEGGTAGWTASWLFGVVVLAAVAVAAAVVLRRRGRPAPLADDTDADEPGPAGEPDDPTAPRT